MGKLAEQLKARGADETEARYVEAALTSGDARPLLLMLLGYEMLADVFDEHVGEAKPGAPEGSARPAWPAWIAR